MSRYMRKESDRTMKKNRKEINIAEWALLKLKFLTM